MANEFIHYEDNEGYYEITKGALTIRKYFTVKQHQKPAEEIERVRRQGIHPFNGG